MDVPGTDAAYPGVTLSDDVVTLRPWSRDDAAFIAGASADPAIRRYSAPHDRRGHPAPPPSITDAEATIDEFAARWRAFANTGIPSGVAFAITEARAGEVAGMCGVDDWSPAVQGLCTKARCAHTAFGRTSAAM